MMMPQTEAEMAAMIRDADGPLAIRGGGTRGVWVAGDPLSVAGVSGIEIYEPGALTMVVRAGTPVAEVEAVLAAENQQLAFEPMDARVLLGTNGAPTIGGVMAANVSGPRRVQAGAARDFALGVRFVDGSGTVISNGGRVMKNVTGYDLVRLLCGSYGTLGVLSEVSLKVLPRPETAVTLRVHEVSGASGLAAMTRAANSPFEVSAAAHLGGDVYLRLEGFDASVAYRTDELKSLLGDLGDVSVCDTEDFWQSIRDVRPLAEFDYVWRIVMAPSAMYGGFLAEVDKQIEGSVLVDWAGGLCWLGVAADKAGGLHEKVQRWAGDPVVNGGGGGHATLIKAPGADLARVARFQPETPAVAALGAGLRARFDPRGILNAGLMG